VDGETILMVIGAIDVGTVQTLEQALSEALDEEPGTLTVDLRRVNHIDSLGVHVIVRALRRSRTNGVILRLCVGPRARIEKVLELSGLRGALPIIENC
jgi:anti-sigma B factor antagonist